MQFSSLSNFWQKIESESSRLKITQILSEMFSSCQGDEIDKICYLSLGVLAPQFKGIEFQMAEKNLMKSISLVTGISLGTVEQQLLLSGDIGDTLFTLRSHASASNSLNSNITINEVYQQLIVISQDSGNGSQQRKIHLLSQLFLSVDPLSCKYLARIVVGKLRLGFSDMTIIDALSWMVTGDKTFRPDLEAAFNVRCDVGEIASLFKTQGIETIRQITPKPGVPLRPARATAVGESGEILDKMNMNCIVESKYDGFRVQIHIGKDISPQKVSEELSLFEAPVANTCVKIFSRNLEDITFMFPDLVKAALELGVTSAILDGEALAVDPVTGEILDFQETIKRKRKHQIDQMAKDIPLTAFIFDLLYLDGKVILHKPLLERSALLNGIFAKMNTDSHLQRAPQQLVTSLSVFEQLFATAAADGLEGIMVKKPDAPYRAGARDFTWIKYKVGMQKELADTVDVVVMGYFAGKGKWTKFGIGKLLVGILDGDNIVALSKVGSGLSEENIGELKKRLEPLQVSQMPKNYLVDSVLTPNFWVYPKVVIELRADSISKSSIYKSGLSLRFPRFIRFRDDKNVGDITKVEDLG